MCYSPSLFINLLFRVLKSPYRTVMLSYHNPARPPIVSLTLLASWETSRKFLEIFLQFKCPAAPARYTFWQRVGKEKKLKLPASSSSLIPHRSGLGND
jgi:hypothetical protein